MTPSSPFLLCGGTSTFACIHSSIYSSAFDARARGTGCAIASSAPTDQLWVKISSPMVVADRKRKKFRQRLQLTPALGRTSTVQKLKAAHLTQSHRTSFRQLAAELGTRIGVLPLPGASLPTSHSHRTGASSSPDMSQD